MRSVLITALCAACSATSVPEPDNAGWTEFSVGEVAKVTTRFLDQAQYTVSDATRADIEGRCPRIRRGRAVSETKTFHKLTLAGDGLDRVYLVNAWLPDDKLAVAQHRMEEGQLVAPVGCSTCTLIFGVAVEGGRAAACMGPGYSLTFANGALTSP